MKRALGTLLLLATIAAPVRAQIPTTDVLLNSTQTMAFFQLMEQVKQLKDQLEQAKRMYDSLNGARGMGSLLNNPAAREYLPREWRQIYSDLETGSAGGLSGSIGAIRKLAATADRGTLRPETRTVLDKHADDGAIAQGVSEEGYRQASTRFRQLQSFIDQIDASSDAKATADLQARIQAEQAMLQNEGIKLQLVSMLVQAERQLEEQRARERFLQTAGPARIRLR